MLDILEEIEKMSEVENKQTEISFTFNQKIEPNQTEMQKTENYSNIADEDLKNQVKVLILKVNNDSFKSDKKTYDLQICGKKMVDYVKLAVKDYCTTDAEIDSKEDFLNIAKQYVDKKYKYTLVLFTDAPLIQQKTVKDIVEYFVMKSLSVLKFTRGYMFETEYLEKIDRLLSPQMQYFEEEDFITCYNPKQFSLVCDIMKSRIITYHQKNGVIFHDVATTSIDANVSIESQVEIFGNNKILGDTVLEQKAIVKNNNIIENSIVMQNACLENSVIKQSVVGKNSVIENFCTVKDKSIIGDNCVLCGYNYVSHKSLKNSTILKPFDKVE